MHEENAETKYFNQTQLILIIYYRLMPKYRTALASSIDK